MAIIKYSKKKQGNKKLSENFSVSEFSCKDGSDKLLVDEKLVNILQIIRTHFKKPLTISSAYRNKKYNSSPKVGSGNYSLHITGQAADIYIKGIEPLEIAKYAEKLGILGIGYYPNKCDRFVHIDTRTKKYFWKTSKTVATHGGKPLYANTIKKHAKINDNTIDFLKTYKYSYALIEKLAIGMGAK